ncbi:MAG: DUF4838 domain-containing protein, partial [Lentisphaeria bacterium]|nr:DUF4838 domain-containing protein [Lentisphaeria bacterium]
YRDFTSMPLEAGDIVQWKIRNFSDGREAAGSVKVFHDHSWTLIYPAPKSLYSRCNTDGITAFKKNPEFFYADRNGRRIDPKFNFALCLTNQEMWKDVAQRNINLRKWYKKYYKRPIRYDMFTLSPSDGTYCHCKECEKRYINITEKDAVAWRSKNPRMFSNTQLVLDYYRGVTKHLAAQCPYMEAAGLIYDHYQYAWKIKREKMPPQFSAMMAPLHISYGPGRCYSGLNKAWHQWLNDWDGMFERKYYYGLDFWFKQYTGVPWPVFAKLRNETFPVLAKKGFNGSYMYGMDALGVSAVHNYLLMQQTWNPDLDAEKAFHTFCDQAYGQGGKYVKEIYLLAEKNMTSFMTSLKGKMGYYMTPELMKAVYAKDWTQFRILMEKAIKAPKDANQQWRLEHFVRNMRLCNYHLEKMGLIQPDKSSLLYLSDKEYTAWTAHRTRGKDYYTKGGKWNFYLPQPIENRYGLKANIPVKETRAVSFPGTDGKPWFRLTVEFLVKAVSDRVTFRIEQKCFINPATKKPYLDGIPYFNVFTPAGDLCYSGIAEKNVISFPAEKGKTYYMWVYPQTDNTYGNRWRITQSNSPYALGSRIQPAGLQIGMVKGNHFYFHVPGDVRKTNLILRAWGDFDIYDPDGKRFTSVKCDGYKIVPLQAGSKLKSGLYKLIATSNSLSGVIRFSGEMPGYFIQDPAHALLVTLDPAAMDQWARKIRF